MNLGFEADQLQTVNLVDTLTRLIQFQQVLFFWIMDLLSFAQVLGPFKVRKEERYRFT